MAQKFPTPIHYSPNPAVSYTAGHESTEFIYGSYSVAKEKLNGRQELTKKEGY